MTFGRDWTAEEIEVLRRIHGSGLSLDSQIHLLPGRTYSATKSKMDREDWGPKKRPKCMKMRARRVNAVDLRGLLAALESGPMTNRQIGDALGFGRTAVDRRISAARAAGLIHISGSSDSNGRKSYSVRCWALGDEPDVVSDSRREREERELRKLRQARQWTHAAGIVARRDPLTAAFFGVVA